VPGKAVATMPADTPSARVLAEPPKQVRVPTPGASNVRHDHQPHHLPDQHRTSAASAIGVTKSYGSGDAAVVALDDVSIDFEAGRFTAIMGPSGSGKSTLLHVLAGLDRPTAGTITISGVDITKLSDKKLTLLRRDKLGFIFQSFNLLPTLTAAENITLPIRIAVANLTSTGSTPSCRPSASAVGWAPPVGALRRPAAAGRRGPGAREPPRRRLRRRADGRARLPRRRRAARLPAQRRSRLRPDRS
jgi:ABC-type sugar transport system ATPase subunit